MSKVAIVTIYDMDNYGNRLQNFALQEAIKSLQKDVYTLPNMFKTNYCETKALTALLYLCKKVQFFLKNIFKFLRYIHFLSFNRKIKKGHFISKSNAMKIEREYDYFVCGSDQVWNPKFFKDFYIYMLGFSIQKKNIALSASIALKDLDASDINKMEPYIRNFKEISVRESNAVSMLNKYFNVSVTCLIDPTLYFGVEFRRRYEKKPTFLKKNKYVLFYYLGEKDEKVGQLLNFVREKTGFIVIDLMNKKSLAYYTGPSEFIYLIDNANYIITNSFHGCAFSCIFNKDFRIIQRNSKVDMSSRLNNLIETFSLDECVLNLNETGQFSEKTIFKKTDFSTFNKRICLEKEKYISFLKNNLV